MYFISAGTLEKKVKKSSGPNARGHDFIRPHGGRRVVDILKVTIKHTRSTRLVLVPSKLRHRKKEDCVFRRGRTGR